MVQIQTLSPVNNSVMIPQYGSDILSRSVTISTTVN